MADAAHPPHRHLSPETIRFCPLCGAGLAPKPIGPDKRPEMVCSGCEFIFYVNQKVVAGTIPWQDGRLLLTRRAIEPAIGKWTFPGGGDARFPRAAGRRGSRVGQRATHVTAVSRSLVR